MIKGTNYNRDGEVLVDYAYQTVKAAQGLLFESNVSMGVYTALFGTYNIEGYLTSAFGTLLHRSIYIQD